jgi:hypothetical protein
VEQIRREPPASDRRLHPPDRLPLLAGQLHRRGGHERRVAFLRPLRLLRPLLAEHRLEADPAAPHELAGRLRVGRGPALQRREVQAAAGADPLPEAAGRPRRRRIGAVRGGEAPPGLAGEAGGQERGDRLAERRTVELRHPAGQLDQGVGQERGLVQDRLDRFRFDRPGLFREADDITGQLAAAERRQDPVPDVDRVVGREIGEGPI